MMGRTTLGEKIREIFITVRKESGGPEITRRQFLQAAAVAGAGTGLLPGSGLLRRAVNEATAPRIAVVGAGLAGLTCAYRLGQKGYKASLFEASSRMGGRCWSDRDTFAQGQVAEHGGELIDSGHLAIKHLAQELGLDLENCDRAMANDAEELFYFDGAPYTYKEATNDIKQVWQKIHADVSAASYPTLYNVSTERGRALDQMSITDWIEESIPSGISSRLGRLLAIAYTCYYGGEAADQSSLNLLYMMGYRGHGNLRMYGPSNERYHVRGGNGQIPERMVEALPGQIQAGHALAAIRRNSNGSYTLHFHTDGGTKSVVADKVVLTVPFSILRTMVDFSRAGFRPLKETAIREMGMGTNSKLNLQFTRRLWQEQGCNADTYADTGYQETWEATRAQPGEAGILVNFTGGAYGAGFDRGTAEERAREFLAQLEPVMPGISAQWNGNATLNYWPGYRWTRGSYSYWRVGQYTKFAGVEREREGNCHFAGEHTSVDFQGFLNGAVESGDRAAAEILADLKRQ